MLDLRQAVKEELVPQASPLQLRIVAHMKSRSFGDELVDLRTGDLLLRVLRDRGRLFAEFGSSSQPGVWFDSSVVLEYLGLSATYSFHDEDLTHSLRGIGLFLRTMKDELKGLFSIDTFPQLRPILETIQKQQVENDLNIKLP